MDLRPFIEALPKTETHLHVEGALPYELLRELDPDRFPPEPAFRRRDHRFANFPEFDRTLLQHALPWFTSAERYHVAAKRMFARQAALNIRYVETSFHLPVTQFIHVSGPEIIAAILSAVPAGMTVRVFAGMPRNAYTGQLKAVIDELVDWDDLAGVDLHGFEVMPTESWTAPVWARVRAAGKITKCHAGEFGGADRVREAIEDLGVRRIQHGVRAVEDAAVLKLAADVGATFDVCPISNVRLRVVPSMAEHPLRRLMQAGVRCTLSTDDPLCFANSLVDEYLAIASECDFNASELAALARAGWEVAEVASEERRRALGEIDRLAEGNGSH